MRLVVLALVLSVGGAGVAQARCADELDALRLRVERQQKLRPTPQTAAAAKELKKADENAKQMDEVDCYNALDRARRALNAPMPTEAKAKDKD